MSGFSRYASVALLLLLSGCATPAAENSGESITVSRRPWFGLCTGVCPNYDVTVEGSGRVWAIGHRAGAADALAAPRVSRRQLARFRGLLAPYRPAAGHGEPDQCKHAVNGQEAKLVMDVREIDIRWSRKGRSDQLIACDVPENARLVAAIAEALAALGLSADGRPVDRE